MLIKTKYLYKTINNGKAQSNDSNNMSTYIFHSLRAHSL